MDRNCVNESRTSQAVGPWAPTDEPTETYDFFAVHVHHDAVVKHGPQAELRELGATNQEPQTVTRTLARLPRIRLNTLNPHLARPVTHRKRNVKVRAEVHGAAVGRRNLGVFVAVAVAELTGSGRPCGVVKVGFVPVWVHQRQRRAVVAPVPVSVCVGVWVCGFVGLCLWV